MVEIHRIRAEIHGFMCKGHATLGAWGKKSARKFGTGFASLDANT
jgi:hypothetical protein